MSYDKEAIAAGLVSLLQMLDEQKVNDSNKIAEVIFLDRLKADYEKGLDEHTAADNIHRHAQFAIQASQLFAETANEAAESEEKMRSLT